MIQIYFEGVVVVGVTRENVARLTAGEPLQVLLHRPVERALVVFGETKPEILASLEQQGVEIPDVVKASAHAEPL